MTVAAVLLAYAGGLGSPMLSRARWTARAPLLAIVVYLAAGWSVIAALGLAGLTLAVHATVASPAPALAAGATDSVQRIHRLLGPAELLGRARRQLLRVTAAALTQTRSCSP